MSHSGSTRLKLRRARDLLNVLRDGIATDATHRDNWILISKSEGKRKVVLPGTDESISLIAGEIIYQVRSALDHLAFDLVKLNRKNVSLLADWEEKVHFPTWTKLKAGQTLPLPYGVFKDLPGIPTEAHGIIEKVQPYYGPGVAAINNYLKFLVALSNIDKHRRLALTRPRALFSETQELESGMRSSSAVSLDHGAELPDSLAVEVEGDPVVSVARSISLVVTFNESDALGDAISKPIVELLEELIDHVSKDVVVPLENVFRNDSAI